MPRSSCPASQPRVLADLQNLGPKSILLLEAANLRTVAALRGRGAIAAYVALKRTQPGVTHNMLYALVGALEGLD